MRALWHRLKVIWSVLWKAVLGFQEHNVTRLASSIAYFGILSMAPLLVILITVGGYVFGQRAAEGLLVGQLEGTLGTEVARALQSMIASASQSGASVPATIAAVVVLFWAASRLIGGIRGSLNTIWEVEGRGGGGFKGYAVGKAIDLAMVAGLAVLMLVTLAANTAANTITHYFAGILPFPSVVLQAGGVLFTFLVTLSLLAIIFRTLPNIDLCWRDVGLGALLSAVFFTIGNYFLGFYLARSSAGSVFGAAGSFVVIMVWVYYSAIIVLFGVELAKANRQRKQDARTKGSAITTDRVADRRRAA